MRIGVLARLMTSAGSHRNAGISRYSARLLDAWLRDPGEHRFEVFVRSDFEVPESWRRPEVRFHRVFRPIKGYNFLVEWLLAPMLGRRMGLDVWFSTAQFLPMGRRIPRVAMVHDLTPFVVPEFFDHGVRWREQKLIARTCRLADRLVANSESTKADIVARFGIDAGRVAVTPLGPGNDALDAVQEPVPRPDVGFARYALTLGTLEPRKNVARLVRAFARLAGRPQYADVGLLVAGGKGWQTSEVFDVVAASGLGERVRFLGYVDDADLVPLVRHSDAFVYVSLYEGFGLPILEAMLMRAPVVASDHPAHAEVGGETVDYCRADDEEDIARALGARLDAGRDEERIAAAYARAQGFTWERCAELTLAALEDAVAGSRAV